jgi:AraC-like DNA-binding protein
MAISVYDNKGKKFLIGEHFYIDRIDQPVVSERRDTYSFPFGDAAVTQIAFSGIYVVYGDMIMSRSRSLHVEMDEGQDLIELHFTLTGNGALYNKVTGNYYQFRENHTNMHYIPEFNGTADYREAQQYKFFEIHFTKAFFMELAANSSPMLMHFAEQIARGDHRELQKENLPISLPMHQCIQDIMHCRYTGGLKLMFLQSKCIELLAMQAQAYEDLAARSPQICKSAYDQECVRFAKEYLLLHAQEPPSLQELARIAGINEFKLKQGFKEMFETTVFGCLSDFKLTQARALLLAGSVPIKQVADELGYSSVQHFSTAFKKKFGVTPGSLR